MTLTQNIAFRFFAWLLLNILLVAITLLMKPRDIPFEPGLASTLFQGLFVGSLFAFGMIYCGIKFGDEAFSRRMVASVMITLLIFLMFDHFFLLFDHFISEHLLRIGNPILSGMLAFWAIMIAVNVALQALHKLSPSNFR
jgi:hypothetical protein